jgi:hypothetical protein
MPLTSSIYEVFVVPILSVLINPVVPVKLKVEKEETFRTAKVLPNCVERNVVLTKLAKFGVEIKRAKFAVETKLAKLAVETKLAKLAVETKLAKLAVEIRRNPPILEIYPTVPKPATVL